MHRNLILDTAELRDVTLESLTAASMAQMETLLDKIEQSVRAAIAVPALVQG